MLQSQKDKPRIFVYYTGDSDPLLLSNLIAGIEEESIPYQMVLKDQGSVSGLAYEAAEQSRLEVGIAITSIAAAMHYAKLKAEHPLFQVEGGAMNNKNLRNIGINAARLVKGIPFRKIVS